MVSRRAGSTGTYDFAWTSHPASYGFTIGSNADWHPDSGGVAVIKVGAATEIEMKQKKASVEDAAVTLNQVKCGKGAYDFRRRYGQLRRHLGRQPCARWVKPGTEAVDTIGSACAGA